MHYSIIILTTVITFLSCSSEKKGNSIEINPHFTEFEVSASIRALEVINENTMWFAGSGGIYGYTKDSGHTWVIDSIKIDDKPLEFRAIACIDEAVFLLNVASPAYLLKSTDEGKSWDIVYQEDHPEIFYNAMKFWDDKSGIAVGDPIDGCLSLIITRDGGNSWKKLNCDQLPPTYAGEAGFAASNTNIAVHGEHVWLATGGQKARVFHSSNKGVSWEVKETPMKQGGKMTGVFSMDFFDENNGIIFGGDWEEQESNSENKAITHDGGLTWNLLTDGQGPGYRSCVQYIPNTNGKGIIAVGIPGISISSDSGNTWEEIDQTYFYTIRFAPSSKVAWLAGKNKIGWMDFNK